MNEVREHKVKSIDRRHRPDRGLMIVAMILALSVPGSRAGADQCSFEILELPTQSDQVSFALDHDGQTAVCRLGNRIYCRSIDGSYQRLDEHLPTGVDVGISAIGEAHPGRRIGESAAGDIVWCISESSIVKDVCADGQVAVGFSWHPVTRLRRPTRWLAGREDHFLGHDRQGEALAVSTDGKQIVGTADLEPPRLQGFYWREGQSPISLGNLGGTAASSSIAYAVSDGGVVVGASGDPFWGVQRAFIWTGTSGIRALADVLHESGITLPNGLKLTAAVDISADGSTIVGSCRDRNWELGYWLVRCDAPIRVEAPATVSEQSATEAGDPSLEKANIMETFPFPPTRKQPW